MDKEELFQARTNPDFLKYLNETRVNSIKAKDIALMYETLDSMLVLDLDEEQINELYQEILKLAFENVEKIINKNKKLKLEDEHLFYARALYEHAIEKWSNENFDGAKELLFVMVNLIEDELLKKALNVLIIFLSSKMELDEFYDSKVDLEKASDEKYGYFIVNFNFDSQKYLKENKKVLEQEYENLKHLIVEHK